MGFDNHFGPKDGVDILTTLKQMTAWQGNERQCIFFQASQLMSFWRNPTKKYNFFYKQQC